MNLAILPLAVTMMAGPQIMLSILFVTVEDVVRLSIAYILAVFLATSVGVFVTQTLFSSLGTKIDLGSGNGQIGKILQVGFIILLVALAIKSFRERGEQKTPKWLTSVNEMTPKKAFTTGLFLIFLMPTDIITMLTVGANLETNNLSYRAAFPFILLTTFIAALPFWAYLIFRKKAEVLMPKLRDWMMANSWVINIAVYILFIYLIL